MNTVPVSLPWWRRKTGCWPEGVVGCYGRPEVGIRPHKILHERFNPANVYLYRWRIWPWITWLTLGLVTANLHRIVRPDDDPDPHDHPWLFWFRCILEGGYLEVESRPAKAQSIEFPAYVPALGQWIETGSLESRMMYRRPGAWFFNGRHLHRIDRLCPDPEWIRNGGLFRVTGTESWSLVFMGPKVREWGFVDRVKGCWTAWRPYIRGERC